MATSEKRWQLLLVADDGRVVPFKRVKGVVVTVAILMVLLGLLCAGLGWQLTAEKVRHRRTSDQLATAERQLERYKSENELITAELVLAEVRMEKAGLPVTKRRERMLPQPAPGVEEQGITAAPATDAGEPKSPAVAAETPADDAPPASTAPAQTAAVEEAADNAPVSEAATTAEPPPVALSNFSIKHDTEKKVLLARLRVTNNGPRSSPVAGQCVVVLKNEGQATDDWMPMPAVDMVAGKPSGKQGRAFKIARFINMEIMAPVQADPSAYTTAVVYVFDLEGDVMVTQAFPITLPAPAAAATATPEPPPAAGETVEDEPQKPAVAVEGLKVAHDASRQIVSARFRVRNNGSRSASVSGRCVVVLKSDTLAHGAWVSMPGVALSDGRPKGDRGQAFRISRFRDMDVKAVGVEDPSIFRTATIHVFGPTGDVLLERDFPIDLPAPEPQPEPASQTASAPAGPSDPTTVEAAPAASADDPGAVSVDQPSPEATDAAAVSGEASPPDQPSESSPPAALPTARDSQPADDPSLTEGGDSTPSDDTRSRF
jgi:hypothetical protein